MSILDNPMNLTISKSLLLVLLESEIRNGLNGLILSPTQKESILKLIPFLFFLVVSLLSATTDKLEILLSVYPKRMSANARANLRLKISKNSPFVKLYPLC